MDAFSVQSLKPKRQHIRGQVTTYGRLVLFYWERNMNKQQLSEIVRGELREMIGWDCEPVAVPRNAAADLAGAHEALVNAMELMEKAKQEAQSDDLRVEIQKIQDSLIRGGSQAVAGLACLLELESQLDE